MSANETELYRHFDAEGRLLYVGISISAVARLCEHKVEANWFRQIAWVSIERFSSRAEALKAEGAAIINEAPLHNLNKVYASVERAEVHALTAEKVVEMRRLAALGHKIQDIAKQFGISRVTASGVIRGLRWEHIPGAVPAKRKRTNLRLVAQVKAALVAGEDRDTIVEKTGLTARMVSRIATGERHAKGLGGRPSLRRRDISSPGYPHG